MNDWPVADADDWLATDEALPAIDAEKPVLGDTPQLPVAAREVPQDVAARIALHDACWARLTTKQKVFLSTWRECGFNARKAMRVLANTPNSVTKTTVINWQSREDYDFVRRVLQSTAAGNVLEPEKLILRQDDIVEQLLEPTPILHQGIPTGFYENRAPAAAKANETLMKAAGILKGDDDKTRVTVRVVNLAGYETAAEVDVVAEQ